MLKRGASDDEEIITHRGASKKQKVTGIDSTPVLKKH
jgi:hypothetical protein